MRLALERQRKTIRAWSQYVYAPWHNQQEGMVGDVDIVGSTGWLNDILGDGYKWLVGPHHAGALSWCMQPTVGRGTAALVQLGRSGCKGLDLMLVGGIGEGKHGSGRAGPGIRLIGN